MEDSSTRNPVFSPGPRRKLSRRTQLADLTNEEKVDIIAVVRSVAETYLANRLFSMCTPNIVSCKSWTAKKDRLILVQCSVYFQKPSTHSEAKIGIDLSSAGWSNASIMSRLDAIELTASKKHEQYTDRIVASFTLPLRAQQELPESSKPPAPQAILQIMDVLLHRDTLFSDLLDGTGSNMPRFEQSRISLVMASKSNGVPSYKWNYRCDHGWQRLVRTLLFRHFKSVWPNESFPRDFRQAFAQLRAHSNDDEQSSGVTIARQLLVEGWKVQVRLYEDLSLTVFGSSWPFKSLIQVNFYEPRNLLRTMLEA